MPRYFCKESRPVKLSHCAAHIVVLAVFLVVGRSAAAQAPGNAAPQAAAAPMPALGANAGKSLVAVIDINYIYKNHLLFKADMERMQKDLETIKEGLKAEAKGIQDLMEKLKTYNAGSVEYKQTELQVAQRQASFAATGQLKEKEFMEREAQVYYRVYKEIQNTVAGYARSTGLQAVFRYNRDEPDAVNRQAWVNEINRTVVWHNQVDISDIILQQLNRAGAPPQTARQTAPPAGGAVRPKAR